MALYKSSGFYWIDVTVPGCRRRRESTRTADRKLAKEYHDKRVAELWRTHRLQDKPRYRWAGGPHPLDRRDPRQGEPYGRSKDLALAAFPPQREVPR